MKLSLFASVLLIASLSNAKPLERFANDNIAPLYIAPDSELIDNSYIVILKDHLGPHEIQSHVSWIRSLSDCNNQRLSKKISDYLDPHTVVAGIEHVYNTPHLKGYSGTFDDKTLEAIRQLNDVAFVERNSKVYANELQRNAPWGLSRVSHVEPLTFKNYQKYEHDPNGGEGVKVYVIDTGVNINHVDFEGRAQWGHTVPSGDNDEDGNGHGRYACSTFNF